MKSSLKQKQTKVTTTDEKDEKAPSGVKSSYNLSPVIPIDKLRFAIDSIMNTAESYSVVREPSANELKLGFDSASYPVYKFNQDIVAAMKGVLGTKTYRFALSRASTLTSGTGTMTINTSTNLTQFSEGGALLALFDECRMIEGACWFSPASVGGGNVNFAEYACWYPSEDSTTPTISQVTRVPNSVIFATTYVGTRDSGFLKWKVPQPRAWGLVTDEGVSSPRIVSGFNGTMKLIVAGGTPSNSAVYFAYLMKVVGDFRART